MQLSLDMCCAVTFPVKRSRDGVPNISAMRWVIVAVSAQALGVTRRGAEVPMPPGI